ncbi:hypothetical protein GGX14DRAFT_600709 [Mycena pura]|uniref:Uncharacterized protein n=1 Tax=Mycena pura TaxID=153505 RepID=A0AAD6USQ3_9AGAR|nr:hypothetical protein GGX14DRAFT_600709 [Mycena pura]
MTRRAKRKAEQVGDGDSDGEQLFRRAACWAVACGVMGNNVSEAREASPCFNRPAWAGNAFTTYAATPLRHTELMRSHACRIRKASKFYSSTKYFRLIRRKTAKNRLLICPTQTLKCDVKKGEKLQNELDAGHERWMSLSTNFFYICLDGKAHIGYSEDYCGTFWQTEWLRGLLANFDMGDDGGMMAQPVLRGSPEC